MSVFAVEYVYSPDQNAVRDEHRPAHREWLGTLVEQGRVLTSGPFADGTGALLIFTADTENDLHSLVSQDPFARAGVISAVKTTEWKPVMGAFVHLV
ncbi:YciI family protein [Arthrobacter sp. Br18]|uniref:YciI family protein n=1 Tax=Arthrobacter sp. Br18 TaxID=1312954 RepID=UPI00047C2892|nr:YciI family protein [Arthrobacter sp. Br18]